MKHDVARRIRGIESAGGAKVDLLPVVKVFWANEQRVSLETCPLLSLERASGPRLDTCTAALAHEFLNLASKVR